MPRCATSDDDSSNASQKRARDDECHAMGENPIQIESHWPRAGRLGFLAPWGTQNTRQELGWPRCKELGACSGDVRTQGVDPYARLVEDAWGNRVMT